MELIKGYIMSEFKEISKAIFLITFKLKETSK